MKKTMHVHTELIDSNAHMAHTHVTLNLKNWLGLRIKRQATYCVNAPVMKHYVALDEMLMNCERFAKEQRIKFKLVTV